MSRERAPSRFARAVDEPTHGDFGTEFIREALNTPGHVALATDAGRINGS